ncbi:MAG TPA: hypothetical protein VMT52_17520, partial [Planctomycetota bacterium]|nr:hypothetical protein [Planctomycetota bacterium]
LTSYRRTVPDQANGFLAVNITGDDISWPWHEDGDANVQGLSEAFDPEAARKVLEENAEAIKKLHASLSHADFKVPEPRSPADDVGFLLAWRELACLSLCRMRLLLETGSEAEALEEAFHLVRFGHRVAGGQGPVIQYLVGLAIKSLGIHGMVRCLRAENLEAAQLKRLVEEVGRYRANDDALRDSYRAEYVLFKNALDGLARGDEEVLESLGWETSSWTLSRPLFLLQQTKRWLGEDFRVLVRNAAMRRRDREALDLDAKYGVLEKQKHLLLFNGVGREMLRVLLPTFEKALESRDREAWGISALETLLALKHFQLLNGRLPASLAKLVPLYLKEAPIDPYDGEPVRYSAEKKIVYSVGIDLEDSGGSGEEESADAMYDEEEPTFRIEF